jgi:hypothetical protein
MPVIAKANLPLAKASCIVSPKLLTPKLIGFVGDYDVRSAKEVFNISEAYAKR